MRCRSCQYDLSNLTEHRCPECGALFDPDDDSTFQRGRWSSSKLYRLCIFMALSALFLPLLWYSTWLAAMISLGHSPVPYTDDPKFINGWVSALHTLTLVLLVFSLPLFVINLALSCVSGIQRYVSERRWKWTLLIPIGLTFVTWIGAFLIIRGSELGCWFFD